MPPRATKQNPAAAEASQEFLARFFHDLATPLSAVSLHLEGADRRVRRGADPSESLSIAREELVRAFDLFERGRELLLSRPSREESFSFDDVVAEAVAASADRQARVEGETGGQVRADRAGLSRALSELLANALESAGGAPIAVARGRTQDRLHVRIVNPGRLPADDPEVLFSPRVAGKGKNWGMGLARARLDAAAAGGTVRIEQAGDCVVAILDLPEAAE